MSADLDTDIETLRRADDCDVMLLLEGTFPYVSGGVSSWVNQIIRGFPQIRFGICFIGSQRSDYGKPKYALPDNVVHLEAHYLHERHAVPPSAARAGDKGAYAEVGVLHEALRQPHGAGRAIAGNALHALTPLLQDGEALDEASFLYSQASWQYIADQYRHHCTDPSFVDHPNLSKAAALHGLPTDDLLVRGLRFLLEV